jgi:hypothetical protein
MYKKLVKAVKDVDKRKEIATKIENMFVLGERYCKDELGNAKANGYSIKVIKILEEITNAKTIA